MDEILKAKLQRIYSDLSSYTMDDMNKLPSVNKHIADILKEYKYPQAWVSRFANLANSRLNKSTFSHLQKTMIEELKSAMLLRNL